VRAVRYCDWDAGGSWVRTFGMLELLPGLLLAVSAVLGSGVLLARWGEPGGLDPFMWAGLRGLVGIALLATVGGDLSSKKRRGLFVC